MMSRWKGKKKTPIVQFYSETDSCILSYDTFFASYPTYYIIIEKGIFTFLVKSEDILSFIESCPTKRIVMLSRQDVDKMDEELTREDSLHNASGSSPSELYSKFIGRKGEDSFKEEGQDAESMLQNMLSCLASRTDLTISWKKGPKQDIPKWIWKALTLEDDSSAGARPAIAAPTSEYYEWWMGIRFIKHFASQISAFELHSVVNDSIIFADGSLSHSALCLLLCVNALKQCPCPISKRIKRWQSLVFETIRLYQNYGIEELDTLALSLWIGYIVPATLHVIENLPSKDKNVNRLAMCSGLIGTSTHLAKRECELPETLKHIATSTILQDHLQDLLEVVRLILSKFEHSEIWVWTSPWRKFSLPSQSEMEERNEDIEYIQNKDKIEWWSRHVHRHESVAGMDTSWDELGVSLMAILSFENRPMILSSKYVWKVWFPHVSILLTSIGDSGGDLSFLDPLPIYLLDHLVKVTPEHSLPAVGSYSKKVDAPFETFQLLSNQILSQAAASNREDSASKSKEEETLSRARSERMVGLMKGLLTRYQPINQVKIVRKLVHDCPHPGLQAKFIDLLRPVIFSEEASDALWTYIRSFVKDLLEHHDEEQRTLLEIDDLVEKVEIYVGAITMIQLYVMVKGKVPKKISSPKPLRRFYKTLHQMLQDWLDNANQSLGPDNYYRLYLLEGALQQVMENLDSNKSSETVGSGEMNDDSQEHEQSAAPTVATSNPVRNQKIDPAPIVGDADIFL